jgi:hypothetical protein
MMIGGATLVEEQGLSLLLCCCLLLLLLPFGKVCNDPWLICFPAPERQKEVGGKK